MIITKPQLPPKVGYAEVDINGERKYKNVETGELFGEETPKPDPQQQITDLELALAELAEIITAQEGV